MLDGAPNFRDVGGHPTLGGGTVTTGRVFRSDSLHLCSARDLAVLDDLGIQVVYDLRRPEEIAEAPGPRAHVHLQVRSHRLADTDPATLQTAADAERWLFEDYCGMLARSGEVFGALFERLVEPGGLPCVFHCYGGKDRTGMAAGLLLTWLGVDRERVLDDYEATSRVGDPARLAGVAAGFMEMGFGRPAAEAILSTPRWAMADALHLLDTEHGGIEAYLRGPARLSGVVLGRLREELITPD